MMYIYPHRHSHHRRYVVLCEQLQNVNYINK